MGLWETIFGDNGASQREAQTNAANTQAAYAQQANEAYLKYMREALAGNKANTLANLISQFGLTGANDLSYRQLLNAQQAQDYPNQLARLSALQALPILQKMSGMTAYRMPTSLAQTDYTSGRPDYAAILKAAIAGLNTDQTPAAPATAAASGATAASTQTASTTPSAQLYAWDPVKGAYIPSSYGIPADQIPANAWMSGGGANVQTFSSKKMPTMPKDQYLASTGSGSSSSSSSSTDTTGTSTTAATDPNAELYASLNNLLAGGSTGDLQTTSTALEAFNPEYNYADSPLYQFQKAEAEKNMGRALRARGLYGSETGALLGAQEQNKLAATEAEKQYKRISDLVTFGLGGTPSNLSEQAAQGTSRITGDLGTNTASALNDAAQSRTGLYRDMATGSAENIGQIGTALGQAQAYDYDSNPGLLSTGLKLYGLYNGLSGLGGNAFSNAWGPGFSL